MSLDKVLEKFSEKYEIQFAYDIDLTKKIIINCNVAANDEIAAIEQLLESTGIKYRKVNDIYILVPDEKKEITEILHGVVRDAASGEPLPYASVNIYKPHIFTISTLNGTYFIQVKETDTVEISTSYLGYQSDKRKISWSEIKGAVNIDLQLKSELLNEVIIKAGSSELIEATNNSSDYTLNIKKIESLPNVGEPDIFYALKFVPGINSTNESGSSLVIRGQPAEYNMVVYDGFPLYHIDHFFGAFNAINSEAIQKVQLYKSAAEAKYGGRANSIIEIVGSKGSFKKSSASVNLNMLSSSIFVETPLRKKFSLLIAARRSYTDILKSSLYNNIFNSYLSDEKETTYSFGGLVENISNQTTPNFYYYDINAKLCWQQSENGIVALTLYRGNDFYSINNTLIATLNTINSNYNIDWGNLGIGLKWDKQWNTAFYSETNVTFSKFNSRNIENSIYSYKTINLTDSIKYTDKNTIEDLSLYWNNQYLLNNKHKFEFGTYFSGKIVNYQRYKYDQNIEYSHINGNEYAAYFQDIYAPFHKISLNMGLRLSFYDKLLKLYPEPRIKLKYQIKPLLVLKLSAARQNQFINRILFIDSRGSTSDFWILANNDAVPVISANHFSGGMIWKNNLWTVDIEFYKSQYTGVTAYQIPAVYLSYSPSVYYKGESNSTGVDVFVQKSGEISNTSISYSYAVSKQNFDNIIDGNEFPTVNDLIHEAKIIQNLKLKKWELIASWVYGSGKPYTVPLGFYSIDLFDGTTMIQIDESNKNNQRLPAYHRLDFAINYFLKYKKAKINFGLSIFNVYNHKNIKNIKFNVLNNNNSEISDYVLTSSTEMALGFTPSFYIKINYNR